MVATRTCAAPGCDNSIAHRRAQARYCESCSTPEARKARTRANRCSGGGPVILDPAEGYFSALDADRGYITDWHPQPKTQILLAQVKNVLDEYSAHLPLTCRQIYYRMVAQFGHPKGKTFENQLYRLLVKARRAGEIPFDDIRDDGIVGGHVWPRGIDEELDVWIQRAREFERDKQECQAVQVLVWCEAAGMVPQLQKATAPYSVPVYSSGGFGSLTAVRWIVDHCQVQDVPTVLLHLGDYDPSGLSIFQAMYEDATAFLGSSDRLDARRLALTRDQIDEFGIALDPVTTHDRRSHSWRTRGLTHKAELEALPPDVISRIVCDEIERAMDMECVNIIREAEKINRETLVARANLARRGPVPGPTAEQVWTAAKLARGHGYGRRPVLEPTAEQVWRRIAEGFGFGRDDE